MAKFVLIDQSLTGVEGHHYEYDLNIVKAAAAAGHEPILVSNYQFRPPAEVRERWRVLPMFAYSSYSHYTIFCGEGSRPPDFRQPLATAWRDHPRGRRLLGTVLDFRNWLRDWRYARRRNRRVRFFVASCAHMWKSLDWQPDDLVFFPTMTEFDFECLATFLSEHPQTNCVDWHLQFHFNFLEGREPEYAEQQPRFRAMQAHFERLMARIPHHRLHLYTTSEPLAEQYNSLGVGKFHALPYPVNPQLSPTRASDAWHGPEPRASARPLQAACAGCVRPEKGHHHLSSLVASLWDDYFSQGRLQLVMQTEAGRNPIQLPPQASAEQARQAVRCRPFPLPRSDYMELVHQTDIGLLMYDSRRYYTRCSGVLVEMLAAGVPVVVPAGCWLGEQIADPIYVHQTEWIRKLLPLASESLGPLRLAPEGGDHTVRVPHGHSASKGSTYLACLLQWREPAAGRYVRLQLESLAAHSEPWQREFVVGPWTRRPGQPTPILVEVPSGTPWVRLRARPAFPPAEIELEQLEILALQRPPAGGSLPTSSVGVLAANHREFALGLREIADHHAHYRASAAAFAGPWKQTHEPRETIAALQRAMPPHRLPAPISKAA